MNTTSERRQSHPAGAVSFAGMRLRRLVAFMAVACAIGWLTPAVSADAPAFLERDRVDFLKMMEGVWSNDRQVFFAQEAGYMPGETGPLQSLRIEPSADRPGRLLASHDVEGAADMRLVHDISLSGDGRLVQVINDAEGRPLGCSLLWRRSAGGFAGVASGEGCGAVFPRPDGPGPPRAELTLSENEFFIRVSRDGERIETHLRRARMFTCWAAVLPGVAHGDSGEGLSDWEFRRGLSLHDQGGEVTIETNEPEPRRVRLKLRDVDWPYGDRRPSLTLYVHEADNPRAASYSWTEGGADRIGINLRWMQASCTHGED